MNNEIELKIINHYGPKNQAKKLAEESYELEEAIIEYENQKFFLKGYEETLSVLKKHIAEEIADNLLLLSQFTSYYKIEEKEVQEIALEKGLRQLKRIADE